MKSHTFKLRSTPQGSQHVRMTVFAGYVEPGGTLANCGTLTMNIGEWQSFSALLLMGALQTNGRITIMTEGDEGVVSCDAEYKVWDIGGKDESDRIPR